MNIKALTINQRIEILRMCLSRAGDFDINSSLTNIEKLYMKAIELLTSDLDQNDLPESNEKS